MAHTETRKSRMDTQVMRQLLAQHSQSEGNPKKYLTLARSLCAIEIPADQQQIPCRKPTAPMIESPLIMANHLTPVMNPRFKHFAGSPLRHVASPMFLPSNAKLKHHSVDSYEYEGLSRFLSEEHVMTQFREARDVAASNFSALVTEMCTFYKRLHVKGHRRTVKLIIEIICRFMRGTAAQLLGGLIKQLLYDVQAIEKKFASEVKNFEEQKEKAALETPASTLMRGNPSKELQSMSTKMPSLFFANQIPRSPGPTQSTLSTPPKPLSNAEVKKKLLQYFAKVKYIMTNCGHIYRYYASTQAKTDPKASPVEYLKTVYEYENNSEMVEARLKRLQGALLSKLKTWQQERNIDQNMKLRMLVCRICEKSVPASSFAAHFASCERIDDLKTDIYNYARKLVELCHKSGDVKRRVGIYVLLNKEASKRTLTSDSPTSSMNATPTSSSAILGGRRLQKSLTFKVDSLKLPGASDELTCDLKRVNELYDLLNTMIRYGERTLSKSLEEDVIMDDMMCYKEMLRLKKRDLGQLHSSINELITDFESTLKLRIEKQIEIKKARGEKYPENFGALMTIERSRPEMSVGPVHKSSTGKIGPTPLRVHDPSTSVNGVAPVPMQKVNRDYGTPQAKQMNFSSSPKRAWAQEEPTLNDLIASQITKKSMFAMLSGATSQAMNGHKEPSPIRPTPMLKLTSTDPQKIHHSNESFSTLAGSEDSHRESPVDPKLVKKSAFHAEAQKKVRPVRPDDGTRSALKAGLNFFKELESVNDFRPIPSMTQLEPEKPVETKEEGIPKLTLPKNDDDMWDDHKDDATPFNKQHVGRTKEEQLQQMQIQKGAFSENLKKRALPIKEEVGIDDFERVQLISKGAFGRVWLVRKKTTKDIYAMKICELKDEEDVRKKLEALREEKNIYTLLKGDYLVKAMYTFTCQNFICFVMEYMMGGDFGSILEKYNCFEEKPYVQFYAAELVLAIEQLHENRIVHRDLKPDNILLDAKAHIKLTDFGLSKITRKDSSPSDKNMAQPVVQHSPSVVAVKSQKKGMKKPDVALMGKGGKFLEKKMSLLLDPGPVQAGPTAMREDAEKMHGVVGTPDYMAPEVVQGTLYDRMVDWWSLGCIIYEFIVGFPPFNDEHIDNIFENIKNLRITWPPIGDEENCMSREAQSLISGLLTKDPRERLGARGVHEIKNHPFFNGINWETLRTLEAPIKVDCQGALDVQNFARESKKLTEDDHKWPGAGRGVMFDLKTMTQMQMKRGDLLKKLNEEVLRNTLKEVQESCLLKFTMKKPSTPGAPSLQSRSVLEGGVNPMQRPQSVHISSGKNSQDKDISDEEHPSQQEM